jgi:hypothetical protein
VVLSFGLATEALCSGLYVRGVSIFELQLGETSFAPKSGIPPTEVGGRFRSFLLEGTRPTSNPTHGSEWMVQIVSPNRGAHDRLGLPGLNLRRKDLNDPQTAVCGIQQVGNRSSIERI